MARHFCQSSVANYILDCSGAILFVLIAAAATDRGAEGKRWKIVHQFLEKSNFGAINLILCVKLSLLSTVHPGCPVLGNDFRENK